MKNLRRNEFSSSTNYVAKIDDSEIQKKTKSEGPKQIYFCKTHKTGGSTLQNIIFRYAMKKHMTIGFPNRGVVLCEGSTGFHAGCTDTPEGEYDVIANHNNWSPYVDEALPNASKITVIRHPVGQHVSSFHFFFKQQYEKKGMHEISLENFEKSMTELHGKVVFPNTKWESAKAISF